MGLYELASAILLYVYVLGIAILYGLYSIKQMH